jgi:hypothetical protein
MRKNDWGKNEESRKKQEINEMGEENSGNHE